MVNNFGVFILMTFLEKKTTSNLHFIFTYNRFFFLNPFLISISEIVFNFSSFYYLRNICYSYHSIIYICITGKLNNFFTDRFFVMSKNDKNINEQELLAGLRKGKENAFSSIFAIYYKDLVLFAGNFIKDKAACEDTVQNIFLKLWDNRSNFEIGTSLKSYLLKSVRNSCLDEIRHQNVVGEHVAYSYRSNVLDNYDTENYILYSDLYDNLQLALSKLPEKDREAFELSRFEKLKYYEIAKKLDVSERTVEVRVSKAVKQLKVLLKDYFIIFLTFF